MNFFSLLGFLIALIVLGVGLRLASDDLGMFVDYPSMFIVLGGTLAATTICFQLDRLFVIMKFFFFRLFLSKKTNFKKVIEDVISVSEGYRKGEPIKAQMEKIQDHFFLEALTMLDDAVLEHDYIVELMDKRSDKLYINHMEEAKKIKTLGKFPPAFGMMGTTIGMIVLLANLGGKDAIKMIGPAMGVCLSPLAKTLLIKQKKLT
jgi:chemotaxis protein MotA